MSHAANSSFRAGGGDKSGRWPGVWIALAVASAVITPIAVWQYGMVGVGFVAVFAVAMVVTCLLAKRTEARFADRDRAVAGVLAASGVRLGVPLLVALAFLLIGRPWAPVSAVLLLLPLYLTALVAETLGHVRTGGVATIGSQVN